MGLIIGIAGACRKQELADLTCENVKDERSVFHIEIPNTKTNISRDFFVTSGGIEGVNLVDIVRQYKTLRPTNTNHCRFFVGFRQGVCIRQPVGIHTFGGMPKTIASFLNLPHPEVYTGHCFRRSSTSMLADSGADLLTVKRHGGWKSSSVAEGYIDNSKENKKNVAKKILGVGEEILKNIPSTSTSSNDATFCNIQNLQNTAQVLSSASGVSFTFNIYNK